MTKQVIWSLCISFAIVVLGAVVFIADRQTERRRTDAYIGSRAVSYDMPQGWSLMKDPENIVQSDDQTLIMFQVSPPANVTGSVGGMFLISFAPHAKVGAKPSFRASLLLDGPGFDAAEWYQRQHVELLGDEPLIARVELDRRVHQVAFLHLGRPGRGAVQVVGTWDFGLDGMFHDQFYDLVDSIKLK